MIIVGDIACPSVACSEDLGRIFTDYSTIFSRKKLVCNLEGMVCDDIEPDTNTPVLYNHSSVLPVLKKANTAYAALANNHTNDLPGYFDHTLKELKNAGILYGGAARSKNAALSPVSIVDNDIEVVIFNICWNFLLYHQRNPSNGVYVAELDGPMLIKEVAALKKAKPASRILVFVHWSLDLENLPYPAYRKLSMALIDAGVSVIVGSHSHCVQGGERYKDGYIVYGLGNFFIPNNVFANGQLSYPGFAAKELVFEWNPENNEASCHWFNYGQQDGGHYLTLQESATFNNSILLKVHSPFACMSENDYVKYFRQNRRKKFLIPIFTDFNNSFKNRFLMWLLKGRATIARTLATFKIIKWHT